MNVKLFSLDLLLIALFLAAPEFPRLVNLLILNRPVYPQRPALLGNAAGSTRERDSANRAWRMVSSFASAPAGHDIPKERRPKLLRCRFRASGW